MDKQLLEQEAREWNRKEQGSPLCEQAYIAGATSSSTVKELEREVERLKGLIETNHKYWYKRTYNEFGAEQSWQQFKTENNL